jgi:hypothetical protein
MRKFLFIGLCAALIVVVTIYFYPSSVALPADVEQSYNSLPNSIDYNIDVKPILSDKCFACHGPDVAKQKAGLRLDLAKFAYAELPENKGKVAIEPGSLQGSELVHRILSTDPKYLMPSPESHHTLSAIEKAILVKWVKDGAVYKPHWAFVKPVKSTVPAINEKGWTIHNAIDNFIQAKLQTKKLHPSPEAGKEILLRRLSLDLTGLPPTIAEINAFLADQSANAYEKQVDRLLNSPHYGEKMAVDWLDVARFADSHGYTVDRLRDMSPYRDWVINAFNANLGYDKFLQWQIAGDLLPNPTRDMIIATAFNRNHQQNMEGGIIEEEFQAEYVVDRTNTFGNAVLGLSVGCAKCHDHKFDPISQKNYYQLFSFFNNVKEAGQISWDDALPTPTLMLPTKEQEAVIKFLESNISSEEQVASAAKDKSGPAFESWINKAAYKELGSQEIPRAGLQAHYTFENSLANLLDKKELPLMKREAGQMGDKPVFVDRTPGKALQFDGDSWLDLKNVGIFSKSDPFSIGCWVNIPKQLSEGVILHKATAERLYNFRGYHLYLKNNKLELNMAHTGPSNAITKHTVDDVPRDKWIHLTISYDGSSRAAGFRLYLDGAELKMETTMDQLTKDIVVVGGSRPALQIGAWERGRGFKGGKLGGLTVYGRALTPFEIKVLAGKDNWRAIAATKPAALTQAETGILKDYYFSAVDPAAKAEAEKLKALRAALSDSIENVREIMVMQEMPRPKKTFLLKRGNYDMPGEQVFPGTPEAIFAFPAGLPKNRYGLAQWITNPANPLPARVVVNRLWQNFFGTGIVKTSEDFGNQGEMPAHPELLDWLAVSFIESGWDVRALNKMIVMSATYRQNSKPNDAAEKDPENRFLYHGPAYRLTAEMIRDNALFASGLINLDIGGKTVKPYQPEGLWDINSSNYIPDSGRAIYRRSLYVIVKRSVPNPTLATFDAPSRSYCIMRRQTTNTPLQSLVTLNDPTYIETARVLGEQMTRADDQRAAVTECYRKLTGRSPAAMETNLLLRLQQAELSKFKQYPEKTKGWLNTGQYRTDSRLDLALLTANTVVASTIMNSDASLTKR